MTFSPFDRRLTTVRCLQASVRNSLPTVWWLPVYQNGVSLMCVRGNGARHARLSGGAPKAKSSADASDLIERLADFKQVLMEVFSGAHSTNLRL